MSFSVSYTPVRYKTERHYCSSPTAFGAYVDWVKRGRPENTTFRYTHHGWRDVEVFAYMPSNGTMLVTNTGGEVELEACYVTLSVDEANKIMSVTAVSCECRNEEDYYDGYHDFPDGKGGLNMMKRAFAFLNISVDFVARKLFGVDWRFAPLPLVKLPRVPEALCTAVKESSDSMAWEYGPWDKAVALYNRVPDEAATKIQAAFRGWQARMAYRYNPYTCLGRHLVLRDAKELIGA